MKCLWTIGLLLILSFESLAYTNIWEEGYVLKTSERPNPLSLSSVDFKTYVKKGELHAQIYPVEISGVLLPERPIKNVLDEKSSNPIKDIFLNVFKWSVQIEEFNDLFYWVGLLDYPKEEASFETPSDKNLDHLLGYSRLNVDDTTVFTMSCATCHSGELFGEVVFGMTKRFPRANEFFLKGKQASHFYNSFLFQSFTQATDKEMYYLERSLENIKAVGVKKPRVLGLDTSLAQVALSLNLREKDPWATKSDYFEKHPREDILDHQPGDSKPMVWWNLKYKTRWLSDGSVVSGNPVITNILWNEIGRGSDLKELDGWLKENKKVLDELTAAVFATEAPRIERFFKAERIIPERAFEGERIYNKSCAHCHGSYTKKWSLERFDESPWSERIQTFQVNYPKRTPVVDVETDPYRYKTMKSLEKLNALKISKDYDVKIKAQNGYVPPPLVGVWAKWPYMHNNSIPNLCALMRPKSQRPSSFYMGKPKDKESDFDFDCNGYPIEDVPRDWVKSERLYDTRKKGLSNSGHYEGIFTDSKGEEIYSPEQKASLIQYLQTL